MIRFLAPSPNQWSIIVYQSQTTNLKCTFSTPRIHYSCFDSHLIYEWDHGAPLDPHNTHHTPHLWLTPWPHFDTTNMVYGFSLASGISSSRPVPSICSCSVSINTHHCGLNTGRTHIPHSGWSPPMIISYLLLFITIWPHMAVTYFRMYCGCVSPVNKASSACCHSERLYSGPLPPLIYLLLPELSRPQHACVHESM